MGKPIANSVSNRLRTLEASESIEFKSDDYIAIITARSRSKYWSHRPVFEIEERLDEGKIIVKRIS